ncbi:MAG: septum formation initiator family protein [Bryobacteraceae bacterium]|jgi:cell division protein FtsB
MKSFFIRFGGPLIAGALAVFLVAAMKVPEGLTALQAKHERIRRLEEENAALAKDIAEKTERIHNLRDSPSGQELEIRKRLKLQRAGETAIIIHDQDKK